MKFPSLSIPAVSLFLLLPILAFAGSGWEPWEVVVLCLVLFVAVSAFVTSSLRPAVVGHDAGGAVACADRSGSVRVEARAVERSDLSLREARDEDCTVWDCF